MIDTSDESLAEARQRTMEARSDGTQCPCCDQHVREYRRKLNSGMAVALIWLVRAGGEGEWINIQDRAPRHIVRRGGDTSLLSWWGLTEQGRDGDTSKRRSGYWRATRRGRDFVNGIIRMPKYVHLYNNTLMGVSGDLVGIRDALGDKFDYAELMGHGPVKENQCA